MSKTIEIQMWLWALLVVAGVFSTATIVLDIVDAPHRPKITVHLTPGCSTEYRGNDLYVRCHR